MINIDDITSGSMDGMRLWVCDYRRVDVNKKASRSLHPIFVEVVPNSELPKNKSIYYSKSHLRPVSKAGVTLSKVIPIFDNTGFRSYTGVELNAFLDKDECIEFHKNQVESVIELLVTERDGSLEKWNSEIYKTHELIGNES